MDFGLILINHSLFKYCLPRLWMPNFGKGENGLSKLSVAINLTRIPGT